MRFLSHGETLRFFQKACSRAEIEIVFSEGFNPRPKISLPLPRSVGVESDDELLFLKIKKNSSKFDCCELMKKMSLQMPEGIELLKAEVLKEKKLFNKGTVTYQIIIDDSLCEFVHDKIKDLLKQERIEIKREMGPKKRARQVEVRSYISSIEQNNNKVLVSCTFGSAGTIRTGEILKLLELDNMQLYGPVRRVKINWQ